MSWWFPPGGWVGAGVSSTWSQVPGAHTVHSAVAAPNTTAAINTTGVDLLVAVHVSSSASPAMTDSYGNTWSAVFGSPVLNGLTYMQVFYCRPAVNQVGAGHTFTGSVGGAQTLVVAGFAGSAASAVLDVSGSNSVATAAAFTAASGAGITPNQNNSLVIAAVGIQGIAGAMGIGGGFAITDQAAYLSANWYGGGLAYLPQPSAGVINPSWTPPGSGAFVSALVAFKPAASGSGSFVGIPCEIITTGADPGWNGLFPPSRANPLPVQVVGSSPPHSVGNYPPSWAAPLACHQVTGGQAPGGGYAGPFPPSLSYPMPVVVVTTGSDPGTHNWRPYTRAFPCPIVWV